MTVATKKSNEIRIIRIYDAPVKAVWDAWTDPAQAAKWWGPRGFTITTHSKDLRAGGHWDYTMHGPDGKDWPNYATYHEVEKYAKLTYGHGAAGAGKPPLFEVTALFSEVKGKGAGPGAAGTAKTRLEMTMTLPTPEAAEETRKFVKKVGGDSTWDRLGEYLAKTSSDREIFVINRAFDAPIDVTFDAWTKPELLAQWMGPAGSEMKFLKADLRSGGSSFYVMTMGNVKMYGKTQYIEVRRPDRLVYTQQFADENGKTSRHPMAPTWPESMLTTVTFAEEGAGRTRVTVQWEVQGKAAPEEMETFIKGRAGMTQGWTGSFDKLEEFLAAR